MTRERPALANLQPNPDWASLPLFDRSKWMRMPFGEFAHNVNERAEPKDAQDEIYVGLEHLDPQCLHIRRWGKGSDVTGTKLRFRKGDIIFGRRRAYQRKLAVAEFDGICSAHAMVVRAKPDKVLPEFLPFLMMSDRFMNRAVEISVGSLSPTINWTTLKLEEFDLPPLDQQRRIAKILWAVDEVHERSLSLLQTVADAIKANKLEFLAKCRAKTAQEALTSVCEPTQWQTIAQNQLKESGVPVFGANGYIGYYDEPNHPVDVIAITCRGSTCGTVNWIPGPSYVTGNSMCLERITDRLNHRFLYEVLLETNMRTVITGSAQPQITRNSLAALNVPMPSLREQETWLFELSKLQGVKEQASSNAEAVKRMTEVLREEAIAP